METAALGERELDVMQYLWTHGSGTVSEVRDGLAARLAYTTVLTILRNLEAKGFVDHVTEGKAHRYAPKVARRAARRSALAKILDKLFHGSPEQLVAQLVEDEELSAEDMKRLRALLAEPKASAKKGGTRK
jgi:predicted transcriptional regulator